MKSRDILLSCSVLVILLSLFSCDVQKRLYRKGFYFDQWNKKTKASVGIIKQTESLVLSPITLKEKNDGRKDVVLIAENKNERNSTTIHKEKIIKHSNILKPDSCGDKIVLKSGDEYIVKIIEINDSEIKYKRCDFLEGPLYTIHKSKVYLIQFSNGIIEHILYEGDKIEKKATESNTTSNSNNNTAKKYPNDYWLTILLFLVGWLLGAGIITWYMALFYARKARRIIQSNPSVYKGYFEMGIIMYLCLIIFSVAAILFFGMGIVFFLLDPYYPLAPVFALILVIAGILVALPIIYFFKTSKRTDF